MTGLVPATSFCDGAQYGDEEGRDFRDFLLSLGDEHFRMDLEASL